MTGEGSDLVGARLMCGSTRRRVMPDGKSAAGEVNTRCAREDASIRFIRRRLDRDKEKHEF